MSDEERVALDATLTDSLAEVAAGQGIPEAEVRRARATR